MHSRPGQLSYGPGGGGAVGDVARGLAGEERKEEEGAQVCLLLRSVAAYWGLIRDSATIRCQAQTRQSKVCALHSAGTYHPTTSRVGGIEVRPSLHRPAIAGASGQKASAFSVRIQGPSLAACTNRRAVLYFSWHEDAPQCSNTWGIGRADAHGPVAKA